ncbi:protein FAR1-RELATED SEQUENCE 5-like [Macadamia integrifolia]|uniref:protein FAR1-RELATED SEQUENCE 5-like n=1 Tax=Macadamia integrifolia TaxID=60698 RepID=UPI001C4E714D|nr:protein FAR1-RELATED SEQUENCE 5-like [Macadamia integrifolia]
MLDIRRQKIDLADDLGIKPKSTVELMGRQAGGIENLSFLTQDVRNYLRTKRQRALTYGEAVSLMKYLVIQTRNNPSFTYLFQLDSEEQITNIFWVDPKMIIDYAQFGDVISFDTTLCTNKECRSFGLFAGFNHYRGCTVFEATLLYDETLESFKWLFEVFTKAYGGKKPITIFTDQDKAMARALKEMWPQTWHILCTWHLMQNGITHLGHMMKDGSKFLIALKKCIYQYDVEDEFETTWYNLLNEYDVKDNAWLQRIYGLKSQWTKCYMKNTFIIGIRSTQLSESLNSDLKDYLKSTLDVVQFFKHFGRVLNQKHDIKRIPECYILKRWTWGARTMVVNDSSGKEVEQDVNLDCTQRYKRICPELIQITSEASNTIEGYNLVKDVVNELRFKLGNIRIYPVDCPDMPILPNFSDDDFISHISSQASVAHQSLDEDYI